jgi:hypothetical protein
VEVVGLPAVGRGLLLPPRWERTDTDTDTAAKRPAAHAVAIAGTFVIVSGVAYFAFMAAWLNVFQWIGMLRPVEIALGLVMLLKPEWIEG